jgi:excisionase family DNA binding protein
MCAFVRNRQVIPLRRRARRAHYLFMTIEPLWCAKDVATRLGVEERTAVRLLRTGEIDGFKVNGRVWRTSRENVERYIARELRRDTLERDISNFASFQQWASAQADCGPFF